MNDLDEQLIMSPILEQLLAKPPLRLPDVLVFLLSDKNAGPLTPRLEGCLDADEKARSKKFASPDLGHRFIKARAALRNILSSLQGRTVPETAWRFSSSVHGKPYIQASKNSPKNSMTSFNLSYANSFIAIAVSKKNIGVDIEVSHVIPEDELPWHLFSRDEQQLLRVSSKKDFPNAFFRLWTLKEAIAKRTGQGFATEFSEINILELSVIDGLDKAAVYAKTDELLFHTSLTVEDQSIHLAVSTAPIA